MKRTLVFSVFLIMAVLASSPAKADNIDFACGGSITCTGTVVANGGDFSRTGGGGGPKKYCGRGENFFPFFYTLSRSLQKHGESVGGILGATPRFSPPPPRGLV